MSSSASSQETRCQRFSPRLPARFSGIEDAVGVVHLVERGRPLRAVAAARARVLRVALELAHLERLAVDVGQQAAGRLAVEAGRRHEHVVPLDPLAASARVELDPVVPALLRREGGELGAARARVEGLAPALGGALRGGDAVALGRCPWWASSGERHGLAGLDEGVLVGEQAGEREERARRARRERGARPAPSAWSSDARPEVERRSARSSSRRRRGARARSRA